MTNRDDSREARIRFLRRAMGEADRLSESLELPREVREIATALTRRLRNEKSLTGRGIEEIVAASIYIGCRMENIPRSPSEIAEVSEYGRKSILRTSKQIIKKLELEIKPSSPIPYIERLAEDLELTGETRSVAVDLAEQTMKKGTHAGKSPTGLAASAVYAAGRITGEKHTQKELAQMMNVTQLTIRNRHREILDAHPDYTTS